MFKRELRDEPINKLQSLKRLTNLGEQTPSHLLTLG